MLDRLHRALERPTKPAGARRRATRLYWTGVTLVVASIPLVFVGWIYGPVLAIGVIIYGRAGYWEGWADGFKTGARHMINLMRQSEKGPTDAA